jgi:hypothetical protein
MKPSHARGGGGKCQSGGVEGEIPSSPSISHNMSLQHAIHTRMHTSFRQLGAEKASAHSGGLTDWRYAGG